MTKNQTHWFWSEWIEEGVCDEVQTVLDKADGAPPIVECPDGLDFEIGCDANQVGPGVGYNDNPKSCSIRLIWTICVSSILNPLDFRPLNNLWEATHKMFYDKYIIMQSSVAWKDANRPTFWVLRWLLNINTSHNVILYERHKPSHLISIVMKEQMNHLRLYMEENNLDNSNMFGTPLFFNNKHEKLTREGVAYVLKAYADMTRKREFNIFLYN